MQFCHESLRTQRQQLATLWSSVACVSHCCAPFQKLLQMSLPGMLESQVTSHKCQMHKPAHSTWIRVYAQPKPSPCVTYPKAQPLDPQVCRKRDYVLRYKSTVHTIYTETLNPTNMHPSLHAPQAPPYMFLRRNPMQLLTLPTLTGRLWSHSGS